MPKSTNGRAPAKSNSKKAADPKKAVASGRPVTSRPKKSQAVAVKGAGQAMLPLQVSETAGVKAKRTRVPKNFADQYGGSAKAPARPAAAVPAAKPRKSTKQRKAEQKLRAELMAPSDDIVARLARIDAIAGTVLGEESAEPESEESGSGKKRASRGWEHQCGKCGTVGKFRKSVGVCPACGAIAVRE